MQFSLALALTKYPFVYNWTHTHTHMWKNAGIMRYSLKIRKRKTSEEENRFDERAKITRHLTLKSYFTLSFVCGVSC